MYLAIWINDREGAPRDRIVLVKPLLKNENAAVALLNAHKRSGADAMMLSGDVGGLNQFAKLVDAGDDAWTSHDNERLFEALRVIAEKAGCSVVPFQDRPGQSAASVVLAEITKKPRAGLYPKTISKDGKKVWDEMFERYGGTIGRYKALEKQWVAALIIYRRLAGQARVKPFTKEMGQSDREKHTTELHRYINRGNFKALKQISNAADLLAKAKLAGKLTAERFFESASEGGTYYITTFQALAVKDAGKALAFLAERAWGAGTADLHRAVDRFTDVLVEPVGAKKLHFYIATQINRDLMFALFPSLNNANKQTILKTLSDAGRRWVRTGTMRALAAVERFLAVHLNERRARLVAERVLRRENQTYFFRSRAELRRMGYPSAYGPQIHVIDTRMTAEDLERLILDEARAMGLGSLGFEVVE